ncbi:F-box protein At5g07610-like [Oryza brachyantha]|uniref:F-box domain-containing protein n=1 Tax=Oryza brachyantha TaxID=4533 RepID=J3L6D0_ORYBR|nr:F-box protein At5g07610-like [Oryza brachyantha]
MDGEIGEDVLTEILVRLPYKSLARFQCVSTSWRCLISDDYLRRRLPLITSGVLYQEDRGGGGGGGRGDDDGRRQAYTYACASAGGDGGVAEADMGFFPGHETSTIIDGCNGLLLYYASHPTAFHVVNPTTRRWARLPAPRRKTLLSVLAFDPCASPHYKVVCFTGWLPRGASVEVFGSEDGAWREHELDFGLNTDAMSATMHYFDGAIHVLAYSGHVVRIDLGTMACAVTALPAPVSCRARAGHCRGRLRYASSDGSRLRFWELKNAATSEWVLKHELGVKDLVAGEASGPCQGVTFLFMAFHPDKEVVYLWTPWKLVAFDMEKRRVEEEWALGPEKEKEGAHLIQIWLFPFSRHLANSLA